MARKKITIVGAGRVGRTTAQILASSQVGDIVLVNRTVEKAKGIALDMMQSAPIHGFDVHIVAADRCSDTRDSDLIIITAGVQRGAGMSRGQLLQTNSRIVREAVERTSFYSPDAPIIIVTNPVDAMTHLALRVSGKSRSKVVGMSGALDSARFRSFIAKEAGVSVKDVSALVIGAHGDLMVPVVSHTCVNGVPVSRLLSRERIGEAIERTRNAGNEIINLVRESSAYYAPAAGVAQMAQAILEDEKRVLPCAAYLYGEYGLTDVVMSVPVKLGAGGIEEIIEIELTEAERRDLLLSAEEVRKMIKIDRAWEADLSAGRILVTAEEQT